MNDSEFPQFINDTIMVRFEDYRPPGNRTSRPMLQLIADLEYARTPANSADIDKIINGARQEYFHDLLGEIDDDSDDDDPTGRLISALEGVGLHDLVENTKRGKYDAHIDDLLLKDVDYDALERQVTAARTPPAPPPGSPTPEVVINNYG